MNLEWYNFWLKSLLEMLDPHPNQLVKDSLDLLRFSNQDNLVLAVLCQI